MTKDQITAWAREAGLGDTGVREGFIFFQPGTEGLERFAALVAEATIKAAPDYKMGYADGVASEREACAKVVENYCGAWSDQGFALANAIRART